ncbi:MAG: nucleotidyl transferase AbiEii/AbiGii toxin family protein [Bacteroidales bacterium]|jgi:hypothetical protein|nr:nucleotidyl transferase AbiEii/AbiGii toxin family protein [Bacteroidales bacterium]NLM93811.1 nucleotidyl transferase AbiEii/AbiGii toxin family protein [Bacteroidales bacterium]
MITLNYKTQADLLLSILPIVGKENVFALHGGTAINLFHKNMPRLSVDIDLTYLPIEDRDTSLVNINIALNRIKQQIETIFPKTKVQHLNQDAKLIVSSKEASVKVEVNLIKRGCFSPPQKMELCEKAQQEFDAFCETMTVDHAHLFGGKICAALDRQHPRDLFDVHFLLQSPELSSKLIKGFIFYLVSSNRPIGEMLFPNQKDQRLVFENQFSGMTYEPFTYEDFENTRTLLIQKIHRSLSIEDKHFIMSIEEGNPDWGIYDFSSFPAVQWKLLNINQLKTQNPSKHREICRELETKLAL